jgi:serralysin
MMLPVGSGVSHGRLHERSGRSRLLKKRAMSETANTRPEWDLDQIVSNLTRDRLAWPAGSTVPVSFYEQPHAFLGKPPGFAAFTAEQREATRQALQLVEDVANIRFSFVADNGQKAGPGNERISLFTINHAPAPFWGSASYKSPPPPPNGYAPIPGAEIVVNMHRAGVQGGWAAGDSNVRKLSHELLHTLGLPHPGDYNGDSARYETDAAYRQDSQQFTIMSYWDASVTGANHTVGGVLSHAATPQLHDIAALQRLYGANLATRAGDTTYGFNATAERAALDFTLNTRPVVTLWDGGGSDTLDVSGYAAAQRVDLHAGAFSDVGGMTRNVAIALGVTIERAVGGSGADELIGNGAANTLEGGAGSDVLFGGPGADELRGGAGEDRMFGGRDGDRLLGGAGSDYMLGDRDDDLLLGEDGFDTLSGGDGADRLEGGADNDLLFGGDGDDTLESGAGNDFSAGDAGRDLITNSGGSDLIFGGDGEDTIRAGNDGDILLGNRDADVMTGGTGGDTLFGGQGNDILEGGGGADVLLGDRDDDQLSGGEGDDRLLGGPGADRLTGGAGRDVFVFLAITDSGDRILDFTAEDVIDLSGIDARAGTPEDDAFVFVAQLTAAGQATLSYDAAANTTDPEGRRGRRWAGGLPADDQRPGGPGERLDPLEISDRGSGGRPRRAAGSSAR